MHCINRGQLENLCHLRLQNTLGSFTVVRCPYLNQLDCLYGITLQDEVPLGNPDVLICSVGTEIFWEKPTSGGTEPQPDKIWMQLLDQGWNRQAALDAAAQFSELVPQVTFDHCDNCIKGVVDITASLFVLVACIKTHMPLHWMCFHCSSCQIQTWQYVLT